ncbi:hypothetical protein [Sinorhizobium fredii]|uniref:hypothetical protein n=1 Tax=Rhizobium fredii TaxID=380 RepID=UPI0005B54CCC|nr:hypothetical protein [Sinorhizobium fredii]
MTIFLRLLAEQDKAASLERACAYSRGSIDNSSVFEVDPKSFRAVPGSPFSYWVSERIREYFTMASPFEGNGRVASVGASTKDNFRYTRLWTEVDHTEICNSRHATEEGSWVPFSMGGRTSPFYRDVNLVLKWENDGRELKAAISEYRGSRGWGYQWSAALNGHDHYFQAGLTWPLRAGRFSPQAMPAGGIFSGRGYAAFVPTDKLLSTLAIFNSVAFDYVFKVALGRFGHPEFLVGILHKVPFFEPTGLKASKLGELSKRAWSLKRALDTAEETSHAFHLPAALCERLGENDQSAIEAELATIQSEVDEIAFQLYGFSDLDRAAAVSASNSPSEDSNEDAEESEGAYDEDNVDLIDQTDGLLSWAFGVAFGRFDWRLASGERETPSEPDPFDPLPAKSPGMLPDGAEPFHAHSGILVDDQGHPHDLARLIEEVLARVDAPVPGDVRRWLQRDFFPLHLKQYSKSRRKAPIYWPLSTSSGSYTLWLYYPSLSSQTLYTAVNDFIDPKLKQVSRDAAALRDKGGARTRDDEKTFEALQTLELELIELRDTLLKIAPTYRPSHDDGVQITAAPLWQLFRHKPWQTVLKDTWAKLEKGDYDWAHLAIAYWPDRVREKCGTDKSLAIAHGLEDLYVEPVAQKKSGKKKGVAA